MEINWPMCSVRHDANDVVDAVNEIHQEDPTEPIDGSVPALEAPVNRLIGSHWLFVTSHSFISLFFVSTVDDCRQ